jgi:hypothetical protein
MPHPSGAFPQSYPSAAHVVGWHGPIPHLLVPPAPHTWVPGHVPQDSMFPQPSGRVPQLAPRAAHVVGLHSHRLAVPLTPHANGGAQVPQSSFPPHPSSMRPHSA